MRREKAAAPSERWKELQKERRMEGWVEGGRKERQRWWTVHVELISFHCWHSVTCVTHKHTQSPVSMTSEDITLRCTRFLVTNSTTNHNYYPPHTNHSPYPPPPYASTLKFNVHLLRTAVWRPKVMDTSHVCLPQQLSYLSASCLIRSLKINTDL